MMKQSIKFFSLLVLALLCAGPTLKAKAKKDKPVNVLLIYSDDHRYTGVHALGGQAVLTPNMDMLAHEGVFFNNAYLMGAFSGATCVPSRAMLMSGRNVFQLKGDGHVVPPGHTTIFEAFQQAGYHTHMVGKWHQDNQVLVRSFTTGGILQGRRKYLEDQFRTVYNDWDPSGEYPLKDHYLLVYDENEKVVRQPTTTKDQRGPIGTEKDGPHSSEVYGESAVEFISEYKEKNPFFMYLAFHTPHDPRQAPQRFKDMYPPESIELPPSYMPQHPFDNGHMVLRDEELAPWPRTPEIARQHLADYYSIISHMDEQIGKVIAALKASGQYENTLIIFAGDSGLGVGNHGLMGKQNVYDEDGVHVPLIISGGKVPVQGKEVDAFCYIHDIYPTVCDLAGVPLPGSVTGKSLKPVILGEIEQIRDYTYHAYRQFQRAYRKGDYKLIEYVRAQGMDRKTGEYVAGSRVTQLFNFKADPWEIYDLSFFPEYKELLWTMQNEMRQRAVELNDCKESAEQDYDFWDYY